MATARHDTYPAIDPSKSNFAGKVVVVTGASKGIGKAIALAFAQAKVSGLALLARSDLSAVKAACEAAQRPGQNIKILTIRADVTKTADVVAAAQKVKETFGRLDILINNAGYLEEVTLLGESEPIDWWRSFEVNVKGTYEPIHAFLSLLIESGGDKTIVNLSTVGAHFVDPTFAAYKVKDLLTMTWRADPVLIRAWLGLEARCLAAHRVAQRRVRRQRPRRTRRASGHDRHRHEPQDAGGLQKLTRRHTRGRRPCADLARARAAGVARWSLHQLPMGRRRASGEEAGDY